MAPGGEDLARRENFRGRERAQVKLRREGEKSRCTRDRERKKGDHRASVESTGSALNGLWRIVSHTGVERKM